MPHLVRSRRPCDSSELKMMRPSLSTTGCKALPTLRWPILSMLLSRACDEQFRAAIGMQHHEIGRGAHVERRARIRPDHRQAVLAVLFLHGARRTHVDDVVVVLDRLVAGDGRWIDAQGPLERPVLA